MLDLTIYNYINLTQLGHVDVWTSSTKVNQSHFTDHLEPTSRQVIEYVYSFINYLQLRYSE